MLHAYAEHKLKENESRILLNYPKPGTGISSAVRIYRINELKIALAGGIYKSRLKYYKDFLIRITNSDNTRAGISLSPTPQTDVIANSSLALAPQTDVVAIPLSVLIAYTDVVVIPSSKMYKFAKIIEICKIYTIFTLSFFQLKS